MYEGSRPLTAASRISISMFRMRVSLSLSAHVPTQSLEDSCTFDVTMDQLLHWYPWCHRGPTAAPVNASRPMHCKCPSRFWSTWAGLVYRGCSGLLGCGLLGMWIGLLGALAACQSLVNNACATVLEGEVDDTCPHTYRQTDRQAHTQTDKQTDTCRQTKRQTNT